MGTPAARVGDDVAHSNAMMGLLIGAALGAVLAVAVVATGGLAAVAAGALIAGGVAGGALAGEYAGAASLGPPTGKIMIGSPNVFINGKPAAMTNIAMAICAKEYGAPQPIAQGAATVFINGMPAARKNDKLVCSAVIVDGSGDVFFDDKTVQTLPITPEVPVWLNRTLQVVAIGAAVVGFAAAVVAVGFGVACVGLGASLLGGELGKEGGRALGEALGLSETATRALEGAGGFAGALLGGAAVGAGAQEGELGVNPEDTPTTSSDEACTGGCPISMHTGEELLTLEDFKWEGPLTLHWKRFYRTSQSGIDLQLGHGWLTPLDEWIEVNAAGGVTYHDREGRRIALPLPVDGGQGANIAEQLRIHRVGNDVRLNPKSGPDRLFRLGPGRCPLRAWQGPDGHRIDLVHGSSGVVESLRTSWGRALVIVREAGRIAHISPAAITPGGLRISGAPLVRYAYDGAGDLVAAFDRLDQGERYAWSRHLLARRTLATGFSFHFEWDSDGPGARCVRNWGDNGIYDYRFEWDRERGWSRVIDSRGGVTDYVHDGGGRLLRTTSPENLTFTYRYDDRGLLAEIVGPGGSVALYEHDAWGQVVKATDAAGGERRMAYDAAGRLVAYGDAVGNTTQWQHDGAGRTRQVVDARGGTTTYDFNAQGLLARVRNPAGQVRVLWWDEHARLVAELGYDGVRRLFRYDADDRMASVTTQEHRTRRYEWDAVGRLASYRNEGGIEVRLRWNARGRLTHWFDAQGRATEYRYRDGLGQPSERIDPSGHAVRYHYDSDRNLVGITNAKGERCELVRDKDARLVEQVGFDGRVQRFHYDEAGQLAARAEADGFAGDGSPRWKFTRLVHDPVGRLVEKIAPDGQSLRYRYDPAGRLLCASADDHDVELAYDEIGNVVSERQGAALLRHELDALGRRVGTVLPDGQSLSFEWNGRGRLAQVSLDGNPLSRHEWDQFAQEAQREQGDLVSRYAYDDGGRLVSHEAVDPGSVHGPLIGRHYARDALGRVSAVDDLRQGLTRYVYDPAGQLVDVQGVTPERFVHDPAGNLFTEGVGTVEGDRLLMQGDRHFSYDAAGNRIAERRGTGGQRVTQYEYDGLNRLCAVHTPRGTSRYRYDALGRRIAKTTPDGERHFVWDGVRLVGETPSGSMADARWYVYEPGSFRPLACIERGAGAKPSALELAFPALAAPRATPAQVYYYHLDEIGTPREMTDARGRVVWSARYRAWGALALAEIHEIDNPLRFQGQYHDVETGLHYNQQRYYDPSVGRFLNQDPIGLAGGLNAYSYVRDPLSWVDPRGLASEALLSQLGDNAGSRGVYRFTDSSGRTYVGSTTDQDFATRLDQHMGNDKLLPGDLDSVQTFPMDDASDQDIYDTEASEIVRNGGRARDGGTTSNDRAPPGTRDNFHDQDWLDNEKSQPSRFDAQQDCG